MRQPVLEWIQSWYQGECNNDWEHSFGVHITTVDNPGWNIDIDIEDTELEGLEIDYKLQEESDADWYGIAIKSNKYVAGGDPGKLEFLLERFRELVESQRSGELTDYLEQNFPGRWRIKRSAAPQS